MPDVHIVGAGPAGCFAALSALSRGKSVLVSEEHPQAGIPVNCSGLISKSGLDSLSIGSASVDYKPSILNEIKTAAIHANGTVFRIRSKSTRAYVIDRSLFDSLCCERVIEQGGKVAFKSHISSASDLKSTSIIGADGPNSSVASMFSFPRIDKYITTFQAEFDYLSADKNEVHIFLSNKDFPGFFGWVIPRSEERALVGLGVSLPHNCKSYFDSFLKRLNLHSAKKRSPSAFIIPNRVRKKTAGVFGKRNVLLIGDAAGQAKATTGGGVYFGCTAAKLAGELFEKPEEYERRWRRQIGIDLALHHVLRKTADTLGHNGLSALFSAANLFGVDSFLSTHADMDRPSRFLDSV